MGNQLKLLARTIKKTFGRYVALFAIVTLGVAFFTGLKNAEPAMKKTCNGFYNSQKIYEIMAVSPMGITDSQFKQIKEDTGRGVLEAGYRLETVINFGKSENAVNILSLPKHLSKPSLAYGRMPRKTNECLGDPKIFNKGDIGKTIKISDVNNSDTLREIKKHDLKIVGIATSPRFASVDKESTNLAGGKIDGTIYVPEDSFSMPVYSEIFLRVSAADNDYFADDYFDEIHKHQKKFEKNLKKAGVINPFLFNLSENTCYANFKNDVKIVDDIANIFPFFFILVAALVCVTTMTRMVNDDRMQIGTLKALGYSGAGISFRYLAYSISATLPSCIIGIAVGTNLITSAIWRAYGVRYDFGGLSQYYNFLMYAYCTAGMLIVMTVSTMFALLSELREKPAMLMRPKAPPVGKRIFLEKIPFIWNRFSFLWKVTIRNAFRYKRHLFLMVLGIGGCTALIVAGFGIRDSIINISDNQYGNIIKYKIEAGISGDSHVKETVKETLKKRGIKPKDYTFVYTESTNLKNGNKKKTCFLRGMSETDFRKYFHIYNAKGKLAYPKNGEIILSSGLAKKLRVKKGSSVEAIVAGTKKSFKVSGVCKNYINHYAYVSETDIGNSASNTILIKNMSVKVAENQAKKLRNVEGVTYVGTTEDAKNTANRSMKSMNELVALIVLCAGALALIVSYNLTNINMMERIRDIATVKVLGFKKRETFAFLIRENIILSALGALIGLILGKILHFYILSRVDVDYMTFDATIAYKSYFIAFALTALFAFLSDIAMISKINRVSMTESLKSVE